MTDADPLLIAVDGGGTGCRVAIGTPTAGILAEATGGPANVSTNFDASIQNITTAVTDALVKAKRDTADLTICIAHLGLAGADLKIMQDKTARKLPFGKVSVSGDRQTSVAGALGTSDGYVVALGTGTIIARQHSSVVTTVGGWGFQLSDQGSGAWLGRMLLTRVLEAGDGMQAHSPLTKEICDQLGGVHGVFDFSTTAVPRDYASFAPAIFAAGAKDDATACEILYAGARFVERGLTALGFCEANILSLSGGVGPHFEPYLQAQFTQNLQAPKGNALQGAFTLARQRASHTSPH